MRDLRGKLFSRIRGVEAREKRVRDHALRRFDLKKMKGVKAKRERERVEAVMDREEEAISKARRACDDLRQKVSAAPVRDFLRIVPYNDIPLRVVKFDVPLRAAPLRAVHVAHTVLSRMVMFRCLVCNERFPTFHPAHAPPADLDLYMLRRQAGGLPQCNLEVSSWTSVPPLDANTLF